VGILLRLGLFLYDCTGRLTRGTRRRLLRYEYERMGRTHSPQKPTPAEQVVRKIADTRATELMSRSARRDMRRLQRIEGLWLRAAEASYEAQHLGTRTIRVDGRLTTVDDARRRHAEIQVTVEGDKDRGSTIHDAAPPSLKVIGRAMPVVDGPILFSFIASVMNVPWHRHWMGLPFFVSVGFAVIATAGAALTMHVLGDVLRSHKTAQYRADWQRMDRASRAALISAPVLPAMLAMTVAVRIWHEARDATTSPYLAAVLATVLGVIVFLSNLLIAVASFANGSPASRRLQAYAAALRPLLAQVTKRFQEAARYEREAQRLDRDVQRENACAVTDATNVRDNYDIDVGLHYALTGAATDDEAGPVNDPNATTDVTSYQRHESPVHTDVRPSTIARQHAHTDPWSQDSEEPLPDADPRC
jgi:hypothetical protein